MKVLVTGGAGFIGSELIRQLIRETDATVINLDALTYAGNLDSLTSVSGDQRYIFEHVDLRDAQATRNVVLQHRPTRIYHLAAESHVDRSIDGPLAFLQTNIQGTFHLLEAALELYSSLDASDKEGFRFLHVSTDEVYGSLGSDGYFTEQSRYQPNSPYSASKAASDHLVRAWHHTYKLPILLTNCSNNYGPYQFPEKLIPLTILNAHSLKPLPVYGTGQNVRDWLHVSDHAEALRTVMSGGRIGETYLIGGNSERTNLDVVKEICSILDEKHPVQTPRESLITLVKDRPGHDLRYAIDPSKIKAELNWSPKRSFSEGLRATVEWYLTHSEWCSSIATRRYQGERLGLGRNQGQ